MDALRRDGLLALATCIAIVAIANLFDAAGALRSPIAVLGGVAGALALEAAFVRYSDRTRDLWSRRLVRAGAALLVVGAALFAAGVGDWLPGTRGPGGWPLGDWLLGALVWGLVAYLALVVVVLAGYRNPVARLVGR